MSKPPKTQPPKSPPPPPARRSFTPLLAVALGAGIAAIAIFAYARSAQPDGGPPPDLAGQPSQAAEQPPAAASPAEPTAPPANARFGPHKQAALPPLPFGPPPVRPPEVVRAVYGFAAEHPEVLGYVPCYCGCERSGHRGNDDCFVTARAANGDVTQWEPHGMT